MKIGDKLYCKKDFYLRSHGIEYDYDEQLLYKGKIYEIIDIDSENEIELKESTAIVIDKFHKSKVYTMYHCLFDKHFYTLKESRNLKISTII